MALLALGDGRQLSYEVMGDHDGQPLVALHGTPGSARQMSCLHEAAVARGVALVLPDRAGYGGSTWDPSRTIASSARDVGELIAQLGIGPCPVVGVSGGGPSALACGVVLPDRITAVSTVGSVAPLVPRDPALPPNRLVIETARRSEYAARLLFAALLRSGRRGPKRALERFARLMAEPDARLLLDDTEVRRAFLDDLRHPSPTAAKAAARDFRLFARAWDVELTDMAVPVHVWHGTADKNVPVAHARVIAARCLTAELHLVDGGGHMLLTHLDEILAELRDQPPPSRSS